MASFNCCRLDSALNLSTQQLSFSQPINLPSARLSLSATPKLVNPDDDFGTGVPDDVRGARAYCNLVGTLPCSQLGCLRGNALGIVDVVVLRGHSP